MSIPSTKEVEIVDTYNGEGYLVKRTANGLPLFIPKELASRIQIITPDTEWVTQKILMTKEEFDLTYKLPTTKDTSHE